MKLTEGFNLLATAPDGIKRLRELILSLAVQGKLVPQDPNDEPASELLKQIRAEKQRLIAEGKIKKDKPLPAVSDDEKPFELPEGWEWVYAAELCSVVTDGDHQAPPKAENGVPFLVIGDVRAGTVDLSLASRFVPAEYFHGLDWGKKPLVGDILYTTVGSFGIPVPVKVKADFCFQRHIALYRPALAEQQPYFALLLGSQLAYAQAEAGATGIAQKTVPLSALRTMALPLAPLAEQSRIVAKVEELMALCDALEMRGQLQAEQHARLTATLFDALAASESAHQLQENWARLAASFDLVLDRPQAVDALEQTILQLAVRGLLVSQDPADQPASELLKQIRTEKDRLIAEGKIKKDKPLPAISDDEKPFDLPQGWEWVRLEELSHIIVDCPHSTPKFIESGMLCLDTNSFKKGVLQQHRLRYVSEETYLERVGRLEPQSGDFVFAREGSVGESLIIPHGLRACLGQRVMLFRFSKWIDVNFIQNTVTSNSFLQKLLEMHKGIGAKHVNVGDMRLAVVPCPPFAEQVRIVARVEALRALCGQLRQRLAASRDTQGKLASALLAKG